jgi:PAS domain S-box-containing protein
MIEPIAPAKDPKTPASAPAGPTHQEGWEHLYTSLFNAIPCAFFRTDLNGVIRDVSHSVSEIFGYSPAELHNRRFEEIWVFPAEYARYREALDQKKIVRDFNFHLRKKDGTVVRASVSAHSLPDAEAQSTIEGILLDITERYNPPEGEKQCSRHLEFLSRTALHFVAFPEDQDIHQYMALRLHEMVPGSVVAVCSVEKGNELVCRALVGFGNLTESALKLIGRHPAGMHFPAGTDVLNDLRQGRLIELPGGFAQAALGQIPPVVCGAIENIVGVKSTNVMGIMREGNLLATTMIMSRKSIDSEDALAVETFAYQASMSLQRRKAEKQLRDSERTHRELIENISEVVYRFDENMRISYVSPGVKRLFGYTVEELLGRSIYNIFQLEEMPEIENNRVKVLSGKGASGEYLLTTKSGRKIWVRTSSRPLYDGDRVVGVQGLLTDITTRKNTEEALRASEQKYRQFVESAHEGVWQMSSAGITEFVNPRMASMLGYSIEDMLGKSIVAFMDDRDAVVYRSRLSNAKACTIGLNALSRLRRKDGKQVDVRLSTCSIGDEENCTGLVALVSDITQQHLLETRLLQTTTDEQHRIGRDLHDGLGQELAGIAYMCKVIEKRLTAKDPEDAEIVARMGKLIDDAIIRTRSLVSLLNPVGLDSNGLAQALEAMAANVSQAYGVDCSFSLQGETAIDDRFVATQVYRIAQEAVNNAMKHGHAKHITMKLGRKDETAILSITDDGVGFKILAGKAMGMGLPTMQYRTDRIDGNLEIRRGASGGTLVRCSFPRTSRPTLRTGEAN